MRRPCLAGRAAASSTTCIATAARASQDSPPSSPVSATPRRPPGDATPVQLSLSYSDEPVGSSRARPRRAGALTPEEPPRRRWWPRAGRCSTTRAGSTVRTLLRRQPGLPARQAGRHEFRAVLRPLGRVVASLQPDHTWSKSLFSPWRKEEWDVNDTVLISDPRTDPDVGAILIAWRARSSLPPGTTPARTAPWRAQRAAARKAAAHAATPSRLYADALGRPSLPSPQPP
jgi:hypothetical protein